MELILCKIVESFCWPPHISLHDLTYRRTTKRYTDFPSMVVFQFSRRNSRFKHGSVIVHNIFAYFTLSLSALQVYMIKERCWFSQINFFIEYFPHRINVLFFPANLMSSTYTDKNKPFSRCTNKHSHLETFSQPCFNRIFSNCLSL